jgi:hypothetical protein
MKTQKLTEYLAYAKAYGAKEHGFGIQTWLKMCVIGDRLCSL